MHLFANLAVYCRMQNQEACTLHKFFYIAFGSKNVYLMEKKSPLTTHKLSGILSVGLPFPKAHAAMQVLSISLRGRLLYSASAPQYRIPLLMHFARSYLHFNGLPSLPKPWYCWTGTILLRHRYIILKPPGMGSILCDVPRNGVTVSTLPTIIYGY